ncbi:uncharacterized protein F4822DRAFT_389954 [Hypoxylon trugodes]|uniref:uncharacterized protein n=1 Tax=Hypoxylon trugodes TaxID=326681 RepID=UPI0021985EB2|nr:uncharacterized protein F4822DRAFT_389954 [Hypoxylon trugodes]KAI1392194.1 hypothetical protein F4822DRAFT_389954 [Hypoxylon trugodes]
MMLCQQIRLCNMCILSLVVSACWGRLPLLQLKGWYNVRKIRKILAGMPRVLEYQARTMTLGMTTLGGESKAADSYFACNEH